MLSFHKKRRIKRHIWVFLTIETFRPTSGRGFVKIVSSSVDYAKDLSELMTATFSESVSDTCLTWLCSGSALAY